MCGARRRRFAAVRTRGRRAHGGGARAGGASVRAAPATRLARTCQSTSTRCPPPLPPPSRTNWTRLVPPPVLIGRVRALQPGASPAAPPLLPPPPPPAALTARAGRRRTGSSSLCGRTSWSWRGSIGHTRTRWSRSSPRPITATAAATRPPSWRRAPAAPAASRRARGARARATAQAARDLSIHRDPRASPAVASCEPAAARVEVTWGGAGCAGRRAYAHQVHPVRPRAAERRAQLQGGDRLATGAGLLPLRGRRHGSTFWWGESSFWWGEATPRGRLSLSKLAEHDLMWSLCDLVALIH